MTSSSARTGTPALALSDIELHYGFVRALDGIDMHVMPGEVVALLGDNGAGKSTLLKVMSGAHTPSHGTIRVHGVEQSFQRAERRGLRGHPDGLPGPRPRGAAGHLDQPQHGPGAAAPRPARLARLRRPQGDAAQLRGRAGPARRPHRADDPAGRDALRRPAPGRGPGPQRDPGQRRVAGHPAARRADRGAGLRADQERRGADPPDGRPGHRDRDRHPRPAALLRGRRPDRDPQPRQEGRRRARPRAPTATTWSAGSPAPRRRCSPSRRRSEPCRSTTRSRPGSRCSTASPRSRRRWATRRRTGGSASSWSPRTTRPPTYRPATSPSTGRTARCRCGCTATRPAPVGPHCCGSTAARSCSATSTCPRPTGPRARSAPGPVPSSSASTTGSRSAACTTRCRSTTASRPPAGCATPPRSWASTRPASPSAAPAPAATWPRRRCSGSATRTAGSPPR